MRLPLSLAGLCLAITTASASEIPPAAALAAAEQAFAAHSVAANMRDAFLGVLADDAALLRPHPVNGKAWFEKSIAPAIELNWRPVFVYAAASGDLGYSTGPWRIVSKNRADAAPSYGQFVSVWRKNAAGVWRLLVDLGISHPVDHLAAAWLSMPAATSYRASHAALARAEQTFAQKLLALDYMAALGSVAAGDVRVYRNRAAPFLDRLPEESGRFAGHAISNVTSGISLGADLAFSLRRVSPPSTTAGQLPTAAETVAAYALHIWRATREGEFELVLDVVNDVAPAKQN